MTDIIEIKRRLADRVQEVAGMLLPGGKKVGAEWRAGSVDGEVGQSLGVHLSGAKVGLWCDFDGNADKGDLLDLWCAVRHVTLSEALTQASDWLGIRQYEPFREARSVYSRPPKPECRKPTGSVYAYLCEDRNLPEEALLAYKIGEAGSNIVFPFLLPGGDLAMAKVRPAVAGGKPKPTSAGCEPVLFGWQVIKPDARTVTLTEGEIDALAMWSYGWPALSLPFGGGGGRKQQWIENEFERLARFEKIYIATDMDEPGETAAVEIASRLGRHRCFRVQLPHKDANECLVSGVSTGEIRRCMEAAESLDPEGMRRPGGYETNVVRLFWPHPEEHIGYSMPYAALHSKLLFRPAEMTLWSGAAGSGKSQLISDCIPKWIQEGSRICLASLEMKPQWTLKRLVKQTAGVDRPPEPRICEALKWLDTGLLLYDRVGKAGVSGLLEVFDYARAKYGCNQFVIDSLLRLNVASDDYVGQEKVVFSMVDWAITNDVHLHLVAHARKGDKDHGVPETEDVLGAMAIGANAFNIISIWRNRRHEEELRAAKTDEEKAVLDAKPGVIVNVAKQRNGDFTGWCKLWFNQQTYQYHSVTDNRRWPRNYLAKPIAQPEIFEDIA